MKTFNWVVPGALALALGASILTSGRSSPTVIHVIDGDTIQVKLTGGRTEKVRYIGIDAPEMDDKPRGELARLANERLVGGKKIRLGKDVSERDSFGRLLRYVYIGKIFVNAQLVREGQARAERYPPDTKQAKEFDRLESQAREAGAGQWAPSTSPTFIGNANTRILHDPAHEACLNFISQMNEKHKVPFGSIKDARSVGYELCSPCEFN